MGIASLASEDLLPQIGEVVVDKYRVVRLLGSGGMGAVLEARHVSLGHSVALKVLLQLGSVGDEASVRFFREARATASLDSEHVVRIFDLGTTERGLPFLVMERLSGFDLGEVLRRLGSFSPGLALECVLQAARGVCEAHEAGIVHRDLKPSNLFLTRTSDGRPLVKVLDFGISKLAKDGDAVRLTQTRTVVGSPLYMSPEQIRDAREVDGRTDVWSLGAILYELLSGRPAFDGDTLPSVYASIITDEPPPIDRDGVSAEFSALIGRCLLKDRQARVSSAVELVRELEAIRDSVPAPPLSSLDLPFPAREREADRLGSASFPGVRSAVDTSIPESIRTSATRQRMLPSTTPTLSSGAAGPRPPARISLRWIGLALLVVSAVAVLALWRRYESAPAEVSAAPMYFLDLDTTPSGALVLERGRVLGRTPLRLPVSGSDTELRELVFEADGHLSHVARIEPLTADRNLAVALVPAPDPGPSVEPVAAPIAPPASAAAPAAAPLRKPTAKTRVSARPSEPPRDAPQETEIHLSR